VAARILEETRPEAVVHLAARYGRILCLEDPEQTIDDNVKGTEAVVRACRQYGVRHLLYASTSEVYGDHGYDLITEKSSLWTPTTIYGLSKKWGEDLIELYLEGSETNYVFVRMNMIYGPEQQFGHGRASIANFIESARKREKLVVHDGTSRSWLYISDAVDALRLITEHELTDVYNLSNHQEYMPVVEQARTICSLVGCSQDLIELVPPPSTQISHKMYSASALEKMISWKPKVSFQDGIKRVIDHRKAEEFDLWV
jgi:nucleoside-diphosphate-sugar epimerase